MKSIGRYNPIVIFTYYAVIISITMFMMHPVFSVLSMLSAIIVCGCTEVKISMKSVVFYTIFVVFLSLINPLVYHNGNTILFFINDNPFTLEALAYGIFSSIMILSVILWFKSMSVVLSQDDYMYIFGRFSPKTALVLSMAFRFIPLFKERGLKIQRIQRTLGLYNNDNIIDNMKAGARVSSGLFGWALEDGIITADSMSSRGYGSGKRTFYNRHRFSLKDVILIIILIVVFIFGVFIKIKGMTSVVFYPKIEINTYSINVIAYICFSLTALIPCFLQIGEMIRWNYLKSKI